MRLPENFNSRDLHFDHTLILRKRQNDLNAAVLECCKSTRFSREHVEIDNENFIEMAIVDNIS